MAHLWAEPNPTFQDIPARHRFDAPLGDRTKKVIASGAKDAVLYPPTPGPEVGSGEENAGSRVGSGTTVGAEKEQEQERDDEGDRQARPGHERRVSSASSSSSSSPSSDLPTGSSPSTTKRNRERRPRSTSTGSRAEPDRRVRSIERMRPRPIVDHARVGYVSEFEPDVDHAYDNADGRYEDGPGQASFPHDGDYVDSPNASVFTSPFDSRAPSRSTLRSEDLTRGAGSGSEQVHQSDRHASFPASISPVPLSLPVQPPLTSTTTSTSTFTPTSTSTRTSGHARTVSPESASGSGIGQQGMTGRQELVRRALADGHGHGHGHPHGHAQGREQGRIPPSESKPYSPPAGLVPFPTSSSSTTASSVSPTTRPHSGSRRLPMELSVDVDLASRPSTRSSRRGSASHSPSNTSRHGSAPHSPVLPNGSVGIGPALGIAKAGARLRAIVDDADRDAAVTSSGSVSPTPAHPQRSRTSSLRSVPRRRMTDLGGGSGSSTPTAFGPNGSTRRSSGLNELSSGTLAARRRAKSLASPSAPRADDRDLTRGSLRRVELGTRKRSSASRVRTNSDLKPMEREREHEAGEKHGRKRGATVHFPPTPIEDVREDRPSAGGILDRLGKSSKDFPESKSLPGGLDRDHEAEGSASAFARSLTPESSSSRRDGAGSDTERQGKRRRVRSRLGDESTDGETSRPESRLKKGKERARDRGRYRNGFEEVFELERSGPGDDADPLQTLLASVDINNALRLISQTTLIPGGRQAVLPGMGAGLASEKSVTAGFPAVTPYKNGNGDRTGTPRDRPPEVFVAKAPPSVTASSAYVDGDNAQVDDAENVKAKNKLIDRAGHKKSKLSSKIEESLKGDSLDSLGKKAASDGRVKMRSRRGTMIERDSVRPEGEALSRIATALSDDREQSISSDEEDLDRVSSSVGHADPIRNNGVTRDDHSSRSEPVSNGYVSQAFRPITPDARADIKPAEKMAANGTPESTKKKRLSGLFHLRHSRSASASKWRSDSKAKDKVDPAKDAAAREAAERDAAEHEAKVQSVLLSLPSHPRCEALAYQARSHFQAYYGLMVRSLEDASEKPGQPYLKWNPLRVIRWRKQVLAEEKRRQNWDSSVNEQIRAHYKLAQDAEEQSAPRDGWERQLPDSIGRSGGRMQQMSKVVSSPLRSAAALSRALASDPQAAMSLRKSGAFKEWLVLPSEILAFLDCRGNVDYFVPATDRAQDGLRMAMASAPLPQADGMPVSRSADTVDPMQYGMSPGSYNSSQGNKSTVSFTSDTPEHGQAEAYQDISKRKSVTRRMWANTHLSRHHSNTSREESDHGDRFTHVLKSPIDAIKRHVLHHESDIESESERDARSRERLGQHRHGRLHKLAHPHRYQTGRGSLDATTTRPEEPVAELAVISRKSSVTPLADSLGDQTDEPGGQNAAEKKLGWSHIEGNTVQGTGNDGPGAHDVDSEREEEYVKHETLIRNADTLLAKLMAELAPVSTTFSHTLDVFEQGIETINRASGLKVAVPDMNLDLISKGKAEISFADQQRIQTGKSIEGRALSRRGSLQTTTNLLPGLRETNSRRGVKAMDGRTVDPVTAVEDAVKTLSLQYDAALPRAIELAQQQDDLQDQVSLLTTRAEQLRVKLDAEGNGKIRRQRAQLQSMRIPTERSVDNWFYMLIKYLFNGALALIRVGIHVQRFFLRIGHFIQLVVMAPYHACCAVVKAIMDAGRYILGGWLIRTALLLAVWTFILLNFFVER